MNLRAWVTAARDAIRSMTHSPMMSLASMATVAVSLLVLSVMVLLAVNLKYATSTVEQQVEIRAYLCSPKVPNAICPKDELKEEQKQAIVDQVKKLPGVKNATYISRDQALEEMKKEFGPQKDILDDLDGENPLRDSIRIQAADANQVKTIAQAVLKVAGVSDANYGQDYVEIMLAFNRAVNVGGAGLVFLLVVATVLTVSNTIRLAVYARRREISIMKLVGATDWYIRRPFMMEGILLGVVGAALAMILTGWGYGRVTAYVVAHIPFLPMRSPGEVLTSLTLALVVLGGFLGAAGSVISLRKFLKV